MARDTDPLRNFRFRVELAGIIQAGFSEIMIAETTIDVVEYRDGNDPPHVRKLSGLTKYGNITLKRGISFGNGALDLSKWHADVSTGKVKDSRKTVVIVVLDEVGQDAARFVVSEAWPIKYDPSDLNAKGNEVLIELLELAHEGLERTA